jgi:hypothetical protein
MACSRGSLPLLWIACCIIIVHADVSSIEWALPALPWSSAGSNEACSTSIGRYSIRGTKGELKGTLGAWNGSSGALKSGACNAGFQCVDYQAFTIESIKTATELMLAFAATGESPAGDDPQEVFDELIRGRGQAPNGGMNGICEPCLSLGSHCPNGTVSATQTAYDNQCAAGFLCTTPSSRELCPAGYVCGYETYAFTMLKCLPGLFCPPGTSKMTGEA